MRKWEEGREEEEDGLDASCGADFIILEGGLNPRLCFKRTLLVVWLKVLSGAEEADEEVKVDVVVAIDAFGSAP